jgi:hypothetical protein
MPEMRTTAGGIDVDEQPGFVIEGARVALGPLRMDLVATYQRWENDLEVANANGRVIPFTLQAERERIAGRDGKPEFCDFTVYDRADQAPIGWMNRPGMRGDSIAWKGRWSHGRDHQPQASRAEALPA